MPDAFISTGETFGIELELEKIRSRQISDIWKNTHDASVEEDAIVCSSVIIDNTKNNKVLNFLAYSTITLGTELVSPIYDLNPTSTILEDLKRITENAISAGEPLESVRSGIHVHISLPFPSLVTLKSILRLARNFEPLFFTIGGMGYKFRGLENDSIYCRPITKFGPTCVPYRNKNWVQVFNVNDLLESKTKEEFWYKYGDCQHHTRRYNPVRYHWINLYPMNPYGQTRNTLEFRVFNKTLNPYYIFSIVHLCRNFTQLALMSSYASLKDENLLYENSIYNENGYSKKFIFDQLMTLHNFVPFPEKVLEILHTIVSKSETPVFKNIYFKTHLRDALESYWEDEMSYYPERISPDKIAIPNFIDIHTLRGM